MTRTKSGENAGCSGNGDALAKRGHPVSGTLTRSSTTVFIHEDKSISDLLSADTITFL